MKIQSRLILFAVTLFFFSVTARPDSNSDGEANRQKAKLAAVVIRNLGYQGPLSQDVVEKAVPVFEKYGPQIAPKGSAARKFIVDRLKEAVAAEVKNHCNALLKKLNPFK